MTGLFAAFLVLAALGVVRTTLRLDELADRRDEARFERSDPTDVVGSVAGAFRRFRQELGGAGRFALVYSADVDRNQRGTYQLFAGSYLYPAVAVFDPAAAEAVMVFGAPPQSILEVFDEIAVMNGVWLGRRSR